MPLPIRGDLNWDTNLNAYILNVETTANTASTGVSTHTAGADPHGDRAYAVQRANHTGTQLSASISDFGTTVAATAALKSNNLSDLASAGTARTNLGLGGAALLSVGTTAGTVAAGDDARLSDPVVQLRQALVPSGRVETRSRLDSGSSGTLTSGTLYLVPIWLPSGKVVASITVLAGSVGLGSGTHQWFSLMDSSRVQLATTADDLAVAWSANTAKTLSVATIASGPAASFTTTYTGVHLLGVMVAAPTPPSLVGGGTPTAVVANASPGFGGSNTGQLGPPAFPFTAAAPSTAGPLAYAYVS